MATKVAADKYVGGANGGTTGGVSGVNTAGASLIIVYVSWLVGQAEPVLSDSQGGGSNAYVAGTLRQTTHLSSRMYRCANPGHVGSGHTWTLTGTGNSPCASILALSAAAVTKYDSGKESGTQSDLGLGATSLQPGALTASTTSAIYVTGMANIATGTSSIDSSFTQESSATDVDNPGVHFGTSIAWKNVASPTSNNPTWSWSSNVLDESTTSMMVFLESVAGSWGADDMVSGEIVPHLPGQTYATITHTGSYDPSGTTPVTIERQLYAADGTTVLQSWTALSSTIITGGTWSGTINTAEGGSAGYLFKMRGKDGGGSVIATSSITSNHWGVGEVIGWIATQSHVSHEEDYTSSPGTPNAAVRVLWADGTWRAPVGNGNIEFGNAYVAGRAGTGLGGTDVPFGILRTGIGGAGNTVDGGASTDFGDERDYYYTGKDWLTTTGALYPFPKYKIVCAFLKGIPNFYGSLGGSSDAIFDVTQATNYAAQATIRGNADSFHGVSANSIPLMACINARTATTMYTDAEWRTCVQADLNTAQNRTNVYWGACLTDLVLTDDFHLVPGPTGYECAGHRQAQTCLYMGGHVSYDGGNCRITKAYRILGTHDVTAVITAPGATGLLNSSGSSTAGSLTGWVIYADDGVTPLTITATAFNGMSVTLTVSETMADGDHITLKYLDGRNPTITNIVYDNTSPGGDSKGRPVVPTIDTMAVAPVVSLDVVKGDIALAGKTEPMQMGYVVSKGDLALAGKNSSLANIFAGAKGDLVLNGEFVSTGANAVLTLVKGDITLASNAGSISAKFGAVKGSLSLSGNALGLKVPVLITLIKGDLVLSGRRIRQISVDLSPGALALMGYSVRIDMQLNPVQWVENNNPSTTWNARPWL